MLRGISKQSGESVESGLISLYHISVIKQNSHSKNASRFTQGKVTSQ